MRPGPLYFVVAIFGRLLYNGGRRALFSPFALQKVRAFKTKIQEETT